MNKHADSVSIPRKPYVNNFKAENKPDLPAHHVGAKEVKDAAMAAGLRWVPHHDCGLCSKEVGWRITPEGQLFFDGRCGCVLIYPMQPRTWQQAADDINMKTTAKWFLESARRFGLDASDRVGDRKVEEDS